MSGNVSVERTSTGFIVTRGGDTFTVKDANENGRIDAADVWNLAGKQPLTTDELSDAMGLSLVKENMTAAEMNEYQAFLKQREAREKQAEIAEQNTQEKESKKGGFWNKLANGLQIAMPFLTMTTGLFGVLGSFGFNNNATDRSIKWNTMLNTMNFGLGSLTSMMSLNKMTNTNCFGSANGITPSISTNAFDYNSLITNAVQAQATLMQTQQENYSKFVTEVQEKNKNTQARKAVEALLEKAKDSESFAEVNVEYLEELQDLDETKTYTSDDIAMINQINATPRIPIQHINIGSQNEDTKMSKSFAEKLEKILKKYDDANGDLKFEVMSEEQYNTIKTILDQPTLTEENITTLKELYQSIENKKDEDEE